MNNENNLWWFKKTYDQLIESRRCRGLDKTKLIGYYERHHIIPKCLGGLDQEDNYVLLTCREHIIAHLLLYRLYSDNLKIVRAALLMTMKDNKKISTRLAAELREKYGRLQILNFKNIKESSIDGYALSKETREKMSKSRKGLPVSLETRNKISESEKGKFVSLETRQKLSNSYNVSERRKKISLIKKEQMANVEIRNKISSTLKSKAEKQNTRGVLISNGNRLYRSLRECMTYENITKKELISLINNPDTPYKRVGQTYSPKKIIGPDNTIYNSVTDCSKRTGHSKNTINRWINNFPEKGYKFIS